VPVVKKGTIKSGRTVKNEKRGLEGKKCKGFNGPLKTFHEQKGRPVTTFPEGL